MGAPSTLRFTIQYDQPDEDGWIVARVLEVPGAMSQGRTRAEARENAFDALRLMLAGEGEGDEQLDQEAVTFVAAR